jgi:hypothetical protein
LKLGHWLSSSNFNDLKKFGGKISWKFPEKGAGVQPAGGGCKNSETWKIEFFSSPTNSTLITFNTGSLSTALQQVLKPAAAVDFPVCLI